MAIRSVQSTILRGNKTHPHGKRFRRFVKKHLRNFHYRRVLRLLMWKAAKRGMSGFDLKRRLARTYSDESLSGRYVSRYCAYSGWIRSSNWLPTSKFLVKPFMKQGLLRDLKKF